jgi:hypothetical protein
MLPSQELGWAIVIQRISIYGLSVLSKHKNGDYSLNNEWNLTKFL